jgi:membrane protein implicated in regulation of membrane protease activity
MMWKGGNSMNWAAITWIILIVVFFAIEGSTVALVSTWFAFGSVAALVACLLNAPVIVQLVVFFLVSCLLLLLLRPLVRRYITPKVVKTNVSAIIGTRVLVTAPIDNLNGTGQIKLNGVEWTARSESGEPIEAGTLVQIQRIEGVKAFVSPVLAEETV